jgi:hypothetical protein
MIYFCPNGGAINTTYVEFVSPIQYVEPTEENKLEQPINVFFVRTMSGFSISFEDLERDDLEITRHNILTAMETP